MKVILKNAHRWTILLVLGITYYIFYPLFYYYAAKQSRYYTLNKIRRLFCLISSSICGIFYQFEFEEPINWDKKYIICANHTSNLDIVALSILIKNNHFFMGKEELLQHKITNLFFKTIDIPVNRENKISAFKSYKKAIERIKDGMSAVIFVEGKIGEEFPPVLHPFKDGAFKMALETKTDILPISIINTYKLFWDDGKKYGSKPGICKIYIHKPIETCKLPSINFEELKQQCFDKIKSKIDYKTYS